MVPGALVLPSIQWERSTYPTGHLTRRMWSTTSDTLPIPVFVQATLIPAAVALPARRLAPSNSSPPVQQEAPEMKGRVMAAHMLSMKP